jgi:hypothetical protein
MPFNTWVPRSSYSKEAGDALQSCRQIGRLADYRGFLGGAFADHVADNHRSGRNTDANREHRCVTFTNAGVELRHRIHDAQARPHSSFGIVFVCLWESEIDENAVTHVAGDEAPVAFDGNPAGILKRRNDLAHVLRIELRRECRRSHEIAEHDRQLPPLGFAAGCYRSGCLFGGGLRAVGTRGVESTECLQQPQAIAEGDTEFFEVLFGEVG